MSLVFGGTTVNNVIFNGTTIDRIVFNGVEVYTSGAPDGYLYLNGKAKSGWNAWVYNNHGGLVVEDSTGNGLRFSHISVNARITYYVGETHARTVGLRFYQGNTERQYEILYYDGETDRLIENYTTNKGGYPISKIIVEPRFSGDGDTNTVIDIRYGL
jgi:hypothetical protein